MVRRKVRTKVGIEASAKERDLETIRVVNNALDASEVDAAQLRKVAAVRGLVNNEVRARVWPVLLGVDVNSFNEEEHQAHCQGTHRDSSVVQCDIVRSLWSFTEGWSDEERDEKRAALKRVLTAAVCAHGGDVYYYQGLHDVAAVLLFVCGERSAYMCLRHMVKVQLRDCTRPSMEPVMELLSLLLPVLEQCDPELHRVLNEMELPPIYALSWLITLFAHNVGSLAPLARLFDLFLASHPLMPLYVGACVMKNQRNQVLRHCRDPAQVHSTLMRLDPLAATCPDELAQQAVALFRHAPPTVLLKLNRLEFYCAVSSEASLRDSVWSVPQRPFLPGRRPNRFGQALWKTWQQLQAGERAARRNRHGRGNNVKSNVNNVAAIGALSVSSLLTFYVALTFLTQSGWFLQLSHG